MCWKAQAELLKEEIEAVLVSLPDVAGLRDLARDPLVENRRGLSPRASCDRPWPLLPLLVCQSISGRYEYALPAAAALQFLIAACDVFDDVEDADSPDSLSEKCGRAVATNVATALLFLGERAIARLDRWGVEANVIVCITDVINSFYVTACGGQHLDLYAASETPISEQTYLQTISMKSASQIECAFRIGALLANANPPLIDTFATLGQNLGIAAQITNDIQGALYGSDIMRRKITLPIVYAFSQAEGEVRSELESAFCAQSRSDIDSGQIRDLLFHIGAIHYSTIKMQFYRQLAIDSIHKVENLGVKVEWIKQFLE